MKIGYFSDLHTELLGSEATLTPKDRRLMRDFPRLTTREAFGEVLREAYREADVIVAAGDIGTGVKAVQFLAATFPNQPVIYTPGNHDFWKGEIHSVLRDLSSAAQGTTVQVLASGDTTEIDGVLFCGATLWTDYDLTGSHHYAMNDAEELMSDFRRIQVRRRKDKVPSRLRAMDLLVFHVAHVRRIVDACMESVRRDVPLVVVTHHAPTALSLLFPSEHGMGIKGYGYEDTDPCYASHLDYLMQGVDAPQVWIHGHTHIATRYQVGLCRVVSNPKGYAEGDETGWEAGRMIEVKGDSK